MKYLAIFIFLSFIGLAVFGFIGMAPDLERGHANCIAVAINGPATCPESNEFLAFSAFHLSALKKFSNAILTVFVLFLSFWLLASLFADSFFPSPSFIKFSFPSKDFSFFGSTRLLSWLSLHEASPQQ